jgi:putative restriction endonuclease
VPVDYCRLDEQIRPMDHMEVLRPFLPERYSPLLPDGRGLQSVYLTEVPDILADALIGLIGDAFWAARNEIEHARNPLTAELDDVTAEQMVRGPTFKEQIVRARRGQGVFRANVLLIEDYCRVTKVTDRRHLVASHIKPWRDASDAERLDGTNGLLLSPHIDHLFDEGYITFTPSHRLLVVPEVRDTLVDAWGIDPAVDVGAFKPTQRDYLDYHYANVFRRDLVDD